MKKKTGLARVSIGFIIFILVVAAAYWKRGWVKTQLILAKDFVKTRHALSQPDPDTQQKGVASGGYKNFPGFPLKRGHKGVVVKSLQTMLNKKHNTGLTVDGKFGANTEAALFANSYPKSLNKSNYYKVLKLN